MFIYYLAGALSFLLLTPTLTLAQPTFNLLTYGGVGNGLTDNTDAFHKAVSAVAASSNGGTLIVPSGTFVTRAFNLTSSMTLFLEEGATIRSSLDYPAWARIQPLPTYPNDGLRYSPLIGAYDLHDVKILGNSSALHPPTIDGVGLAWEVANAAKLLKAQRPHALEFARVANVEVAFVTIEESAYWSFHLSQCTNVWVHDASILATTPNGDGCDIGAEGVVLERMTINTADDAIAIKSGDAPAGSGFPPSRNITIRDSTLASGEGCIAIGSEMTAGVEDVEVSNITCQAAGHALLYVKERRAGGGFVRNVVVRNSRVTGPAKRFLWLSQHFGEGGENAEHGGGDPSNSNSNNPLPFLSNITLRDISVVGGGVVEQAALLNGATSPSTFPGGQGAIVGIVLENLDLGKPLSGWTCANATGVWRNVTPPPCSELTPQ